MHDGDYKRSPYKIFFPVAKMFMMTRKDVMVVETAAATVVVIIAVNDRNERPPNDDPLMICVASFNDHD